MNAVLYFVITLYSLFAIICDVHAQQIRPDTTIVDARIWSKDEKKQVKYGEWKSFECLSLPETFQDGNAVARKSYLKSKGFFTTQKIDGRWWVIDPNGETFYVKSVNSIRPLKSQPIPEGYASVNAWGAATAEQLILMGFNTAGCWSDTAAINEYNRSGKPTLAYTVQLNLLSGYAGEVKKNNNERKKESLMSFLLDDNFAHYCDQKTASLRALAKDHCLLGYFSDNELPFTQNEIKDLIADKDENNACYLFCLQWMKEHQIDESGFDKPQQQQFLASLAKRYYEIVFKAIKKYDPNHLYLGSRLHSNAKNNEMLIKSIAPFVDILSINYYGNWMVKQDEIANWNRWCDKPFFITEFYTKAAETGMSNLSGAGWMVRTQDDRGKHYQHFCMQLLKAPQCVGWHWFRYQDNDPNEPGADESNKDSNKGIVDVRYQYYEPLCKRMRLINTNVFTLIQNMKY